MNEKVRKIIHSKDFFNQAMESAVEYNNEEVTQFNFEYEIETEKDGLVMINCEIYIADIEEHQSNGDYFNEPEYELLRLELVIEDVYYYDEKIEEYKYQKSERLKL